MALLMSCLNEGKKKNPMRPAVLQIQVWNGSNDTDFLSSRTTPVAQVTTATSASNAPETSAAGAPIMGSVRMVTMGTGSVVAMKVSMAPHAKTVSRDDTESTAPQVRNTLILTETLLNTHSLWRNYHRRHSLPECVSATRRHRPIRSTKEQEQTTQHQSLMEAVVFECQKKISKLLGIRLATVHATWSRGQIVAAVPMQIDYSWRHFPAFLSAPSFVSAINICHSFKFSQSELIPTCFFRCVEIPIKNWTHKIKKHRQERLNDPTNLRDPQHAHKPAELPNLS